MCCSRVANVLLTCCYCKVGDLEAFKRDVASDVSLALGPHARSVKVCVANVLLMCC
jgi:hypothetical protein